MGNTTHLPPKVKATYQAVIALFLEGADLNNLTVSEITGKAGIGKGTAYEYFSNKEEMIAGALFYELKESCRSMYEVLRQEKDLYGKMNVILLNMEEKLTQTSCLFRAIHVMMDNSAISSRLKEMVESKQEDEFLVMDLLRRIIEEEMACEDELTEEDKAYLVMAALSKLICYAMYQFGINSGARPERRAMREMLCRGICQEIESFRKCADGSAVIGHSPVKDGIAF